MTVSPRAVVQLVGEYYMANMKNAKYGASKELQPTNSLSLCFQTNGLVRKHNLHLDNHNKEYYESSLACEKEK